MSQQRQTLFGYLATRFSSHPENLATESLCYVLRQSPVARQAFTQYIAQPPVWFEQKLAFQTQAAGKDGAIPDLVGADPEGRKVLIGEAKFWAGLTDNQPVTYLNHFQPETNSVLLFIAPTLRFQTLWPELLRRCREAAIPVEPVSQVTEELRVARINQFQYLVLASWRSLLLVILRALETAGQTEIAADVMQLQGLCDRMDSQAFLPLRSEELVSTIGVRIEQYCHLVDQVTDRLRKKGVVSTKGLSTTARAGSYGRYMKVHEFDCLLKFEAKLWGRYRETPLWFRVWFAPLAQERLFRLESTDPPRLLREGNDLLIPLQLPLGVELDEVIDSLADQVEEIAGYLLPPEQDNGGLTGGG